ncbi:MAG: serine protease [Alphaproteobacteria bacterium]
MPIARGLLMLASIGICSRLPAAPSTPDISPTPSAAAGEAQSDARKSRGASHDAAELVRTGTAFFVSREGYMITSAHIVHGCLRANIYPSDGSDRTARIVALDRRTDLGLLRVDGAVPEAALFPGAGGLPTGATITTVGFGARPEEPRYAVVTPGRFAEFAPGPQGVPLIEFGATLHEGNSGGPIVDEEGVLQGVVIGRYTAQPNVSVAVAAQDIKEFLSANRVHYTIGIPPRGVRDDRDALVRRMSALVQCRHDAPR